MMGSRSLMCLPPRFRMHLRVIRRGYGVRRLSDDSANGKNGYPRVFATNVTVCGSVQAILIPPSHNAVIYSLAAGGTISIAHLFLAGVLPVCSSASL